MRNKGRSELEKEPLAVGAKILEMKRVSEEAGKAGLRGVRGRAMAMSERLRAMTKSAAMPISTRIKRIHSLGDFYGKFHPSKSTKGIRRSEK